MGSGMCGAGLSVCSLSKDRVRRNSLLMESAEVATVVAAVISASVVAVAGEMVGFVPSY